MDTKNISFRIDEKDYEMIKRFAKEKRQKNLKGYLIWLAKEDMKQPDLKVAADDSHAVQIQKLQKIVELQSEEIVRLKKALLTIEQAIENYKK